MLAVYLTAYVNPGNQFTSGFIQHQILRLTEYAELEGSHEDRCIQFLVLCRTPQESYHEPEITVQTLLDLCQAGAVTTGEPVQCPTNLWVNNFPDINPNPP